MYDYIWKMHHIWYCIWGNAWIVDMEKNEHLLFNLWLGNLGCYGILENLKMLILSCYVGNC